MKQTALKVLDKVAERASRSFSLHRNGDSFDMLEVAFLRAAFESAEYYEQNLLRAASFPNDLALLTHAMQIAPKNGLVVELGVATGRTIRHIAGLTTSRVYGLDSFEGLPEAWRSDYGRGAFAGALPVVPKNVTLIKGCFEQTLPAFLSDERDNVSFLHVDCDLYSSTKSALDLLGSRLLPGCVIVFDEYWNYPGWKHHEHKAFMEFIERSGRSYRYDSFVSSHQQVCAVLD